MKLKKSPLFFFILAAASSVSYVHALTWDPTNVPAAPVGGAGTWDAATTSNWSNGTVDSVWGNSPTAVAAFTGTLGGAVTVGTGGVSVNAFSFTNTVTSYTISGAPITLIGTTPTLTTTGTGNIRSITVANATIGSNVTGATLNIAGTGVVGLSNTAITGALTIGNTSGLILTGTNTAGSVAVGSNVLAIGSNTALASGTAISAGANSFVLLANGASTLANITASGGTLNLQLGNGANWQGSLTHTTANDLTVNPNATGATISGNISMAAGGRLFFRNDQGVNPSALFNTTTSGTGTITVTGNISGTNILNIGTTANTTHVTLSGTSTYTGATTVGNGSLTINSIKNVSGGASALGTPTTVANGTIALGSAATGGTLKYNGTGDTTDRVVNLAGTTGGAILDQSGTGLLKFTSAFTATGVGSRTLTLQGSTAGTGEISGSIVNNTVNTTTLGATFVASASPIQITLASVSGVVVGTSTISGTGITGNAVITAVDIPNKKVTIASTSGASGATGSTYILGSVLNPIAVTKAGTGSWTLSGASTYTGATSVNAGTLNVTGSLNSAVTVGSTGTLMGTGGSTTGTLTLNNGATIFGVPGTVSGNNGTSFTAANLTSSATGIKVLGLVAADGTVDIARYTGTWTGAASDFDLSAFRITSGVTSVPAATGNKLQFTVNKLADTWTQASGTWDNTHAAGLWSNNAENAYYSGDDVLFSDVIGQPTATVTLNSVVTPGSVVFNSGTTNYTISGTGSISGTTTLIKSGAGTVTLSTANTFTGQTDLSAGSLILGNAGALQNSTLNITGGTLAFDSSVLANAFTLGGLSGSQGIALQNNAGSPVAIALSVGGNNASTTYSGNLSGAGSLIKNGSGVLTLNTSNTFTGNLAVSGGELRASVAGALGSNSARTVSVASGGILTLAVSDTFGVPNSTPAPSLSVVGTLTNVAGTTNVLGNVTLSGGTLSNAGGLAPGYQAYSLAGSVTVSGAASTITGSGTNPGIHLGSNTSFVVNDATGNANTDLTVSVPLLNRNQDFGTAGGFTKSGAGTMVLAVANTYSGVTTVGQGVLVANHSAALGTGTVTLGTGSAAQLYLGNGVNMSNALTIAANDASFAGALQVKGTDTATLSGPLTITANSATGGHFSSDPGALLNITGPINSASVTVIHRNGNVVLSGGGSYAAYNVTGILKVGANNGIATNALVTIGASGAATLDLNGFNQTLAGVTKGGSAATITNTGASASTLTLNNAGAVTYAGTIVNGTGGVSLAKSGAGTLTLSGANTYTGNTSVNAGTLSLSTAYLADASTVNISAASATLDLNYAGTDTVNQLFIGGVLQEPGTWGSLASAATHKDARFTGTGILSVTTGAVTPTFDQWATAKGLTPGNNGKADNPDNDGLNNLGEFAFNGNPLSGASDGKIVSKMAVIDGENVLTLTLPVVIGANFPTSLGASISDPIGGLTYHIEASDSLTTFDLLVAEVTNSTDLANIQGTLAVDHPLDVGWTYRTFRSAPVSSAPKLFLRARVTE